ncbi:type IV pilin protein [Undibacterium arcticum]
MTNEKNRFTHGFTLIEVMIVVAIVAIIASVAFPSYQKSVIKAKRSEGRAALMQIMQQQERYYSQRTTYIISSDSAYAFKKYSGDSSASSVYDVAATDGCATTGLANCVLLSATPKFYRYRLRHVEDR